MRLSASIALAALLLATPACADPAPTPTPVPTATATPTPVPAATAAVFSDVPDAPERDDFALAQRFTGVAASPVPVETLYADEEVGSTRRFAGFDLIDNATFEFDATVRHVSPNAVWYFRTDAEVDAAALAEVADAFERHVLPGVLDLVLPGEALPGRLAVVHGPFPGVGGYFNAGDALPVAVRAHSNERVSIYMNDDQPLDDGFYLAVLAHELQHLVHWLADPTEAAWVQEGFSELAARTLGYDSIPFRFYRGDPEVSIRDWPPLDEDPLPNYAGAALFSAYLAERLGDDGLAAIAAEQADGEDGVQAVMDTAFGGTSFEALFADWLAANASGGSAPPYGYADAAPPIRAERSLDGPGSVSGAVTQMGAWLLDIDTDVPLDVTFTGTGTTPLLPVDPFSGGWCWWSNTGDSIHAGLTRAIDLTRVSEATLRFRAWWEIEEHWDRGYVSVSTDDGVSWRILEATGTTTHDPFLVAFGPSYTGASGGWRLESADLTPFAGHEALLRFDYLTDDSTTGSGWCIDDVAIDEIGLFDDAETDGAWDADGFVRVGLTGVEQRFAIRLIEGVRDTATVTPLAVNSDGTASFHAGGPVTMVVAGFADKTSEPGRFEVSAVASTNGDNG
ncbi:MAG: immune inhibitor A [Chloroflexota bacterium]|nr:immune inhibitor A [Chloroflexota bacterium]MDE2886003.1 immune inhibitor A [Chloroflexota bacterium]